MPALSLRLLALLLLARAGVAAVRRFAVLRFALDALRPGRWW